MFLSCLHVNVYCTENYVLTAVSTESKKLYCWGFSVVIAEDSPPNRGSCSKSHIEQSPAILFLICSLIIQQTAR